VQQVSFLRETGVCDAVLANGVVLHHDRVAAPAGRFRLVVIVAGGEIEEGAGQSGLTQLAVAAWAQRAGRAASAGAESEAAAAYGLTIKAAALPDHLRLLIEGPAEGLPAAARLARALLSRPVISAEALAAQRTEIEAALERIASSRWGAIGSAMIGTVYPEDPRLHLPTRADLEKHTRAEAQAWLERILARGSVEAAVVGDVPLEAALGPVATELAALPVRARISPQTFAPERTLIRPGEPDGAGPAERVVRATTPDGRAVVVGVFYGADVSEVREFRALWVAARVLEERLVARITREGPPLTDLEATCAPGGALPGFGMVFASASAAPANAGALAEAMRAEVARLRDEPPTEAEVARAAATMRRSVAELNADAGYWAEVLATSWYRGVDMDAMGRGEEDYASFTAKEVAGAIRRWNVEGKRFSVVVTP
jgi:predicted Zn-dependent peptidase